MPITKATASSIAPAAKGDLVVGSATNDASVLAVGSANQVLTVDSSTSTGLKWAAPAGGGKVLQVVSATYSTETTSSVTTYADTGLSATITPSSSASKVLVLVSQGGCGKNEANILNSLNLRLRRGSTTIAQIADSGMYTGTLLGISSMQFGMSYLDSPSTTSATTYKTEFANITASGLIRVQQNSSLSSIVLLEIGA